MLPCYLPYGTTISVSCRYELEIFQIPEVNGTIRATRSQQEFVGVKFNRRDRTTMVRKFFEKSTSPNIPQLGHNGKL